MRDWIPDYFDAEYLLKYKSRQIKAQTKLEVDFIVEAMGIKTNNIVLDIPCGYGRHTNELLDRGIKTVGVDVCRLFIKEAKKYKKNRSKYFFQKDMRKISVPKVFDHAFNFFTSFGYYSDKENRQIIANITYMLKPFGKFLLHVRNREWLLSHFVEKQWDEYSNRTELIERKFDLMTSRMNTRLTFCHNSKKKVVRQSIRFYTLAEISDIFMQNGLKVIKTYGGINFEPYTKDGEWMIVIGEK